MENFLGRLLHPRASAAADDPLLPPAIERAVEHVEPRLKQAGGYPGRYREAVARTLAYARELAAQVPGPVDLSPEDYTRNPLVRVLFAAPEDIQHALCWSTAMHTYAQRPEGVGSEIYALMGMRRLEKASLGMECSGQMLRRDVAQTVVCFSSHTMSGPAPSEAEARELLMWSLFDSLVERVAEAVATRRKEQLRWQEERAYMTAQLRHPDPAKREAARQRLDIALKELAKATQALALDRLAEDFSTVLLAPEQYLRLQQTTLLLDGMGIKHQPGDAHDSHVLSFSDLLGRDRRRWTVLLVRCHPRPGATMSERLQEAHRWLRI